MATPTRKDEFHVKVNGGARADLYARPPKGSLWEDEPCGCVVQPCGFVVPEDECRWHGINHQLKLAKGHFVRNCPGGKH